MLRVPSPSVSFSNSRSCIQFQLGTLRMESRVQLQVVLRMDTDWTDIAQCVGTDQAIFFPTSKYYEDSPRWAELVSIAKSICRVCPVVKECLEYAMTTNQDEGIWGGLTPRERGRRRNR